MNDLDRLYATLERAATNMTKKNIDELYVVIKRTQNRESCDCDIPNRVWQTAGEVHEHLHEAHRRLVWLREVKG